MKNNKCESKESAEHAEWPVVPGTPKANLTRKFTPSLVRQWRSWSGYSLFQNWEGDQIAGNLCIGRTVVGPPRLSTNVVTTGTSGNTLRYPCNPWYHLVLHPFNRCTFSTGSTVLVASTVEIVVRDCAQARVNDYLLLASLPCSGLRARWGGQRKVGAVAGNWWSGDQWVAALQ